MKTQKNTAFTLVELLTVIAIIGILAAIIIPTVGRVRDSARAAQCLSNLRQIGLAARLYAEEHNNNLPASYYMWPKELWPYAHNGADNSNIQILSTEMDPPASLRGSVFECPKAYSDASAPRRSYGINTHLGPGSPTTGPGSSKVVNLQIIEVLSQAMLFGDVKGSGTLGQSSVNPRHNNKMNVVFADGHTEAVTITDELRATPITALFWIGFHR